MTHVIHIDTWVCLKAPINTREGWHEFRREQYDRIHDRHDYVFGHVSETTGPDAKTFYAAVGEYKRSYNDRRDWFHAALNEPISRRLQLFKERGWIQGYTNFSRKRARHDSR